MENRLTDRTADGSCVISEEVIAEIASTAALEVPGVAGMAARPDAALRSIGRVAAGKGAAGASRSVKVLSNENVTVVDVYLNLKLGTRIPDVAGRVQEGVKAAVQSMTGRPVTKVNVHVADVVLGDETDSQD